MDEERGRELRRAAGLLAPARRLLVLAGAGLSADAGVPTFRGDGGLWRDERIRRLATRDGFEEEPDAVWEWYRVRREQIAGCEPHAGQRTLALLQRHAPGGMRVLVATTNEDDLLERAGAQGVLHLHGDCFETACAEDCGWRERDADDNALSFLPCPRCGGEVRPGSVWFGEPVPQAVLGALESYDPDACLVVGCSSLVQPVSAIPPEMAMAKRPVVEINLAETPLSGIAALSLRGRAADLLPDLVDQITSQTVQRQTGNHAPGPGGGNPD